MLTARRYLLHWDSCQAGIFLELNVKLLYNISGEIIPNIWNNWDYDISRIVRKTYSSNPHILTLFFKICIWMVLNVGEKEDRKLCYSDGEQRNAGE